MNKKLLGVLGVAALLLAGNFAWQEVKETKTVEAATTIYMNPNGKEAANAWFAARCWKGSAEKWYKMTDEDKDGIFEANIDTVSYPNVIFTRMDPNKTALSWDSKWNQSGDLTFPTNGNNMWTWGSGWDGDTGNWSKYAKVETFDILGGQEFFLQPNNEWKSDNAWFAAYFFDNSNNNAWTKAIDYGNDGIYKVVVPEGTWSKVIFTRMDPSKVELNWDSKWSQTINVSWDGKSNLYSLDTASWDTGTWSSRTETDFEKVCELFYNYYNNGSYTKVTTLNVNEFAENEVQNYFHAGAQAKYRQTVYSYGQLVMKSSKTEVADWSKITNTSTYKDVTGGVAHLKNGTEDYRVSGTVNGEDRSSVENWFVTLCDFKDSSETGWTYANDVYSFDLSTSETLTDMARQFVAPMWLNTTEAQNYVVFTELTVEEDNGSLVIKLYASGDTGKITDASGVFAQATITK